MATYTTNLNLKKPTTDEMYNVLDWNQNSDKIDAAILASLGTNLATRSAVETALNTLLSSLADRAVRHISFTTTTGIEAPFTNAGYGGIFVRNNATRARIILMRSGYDEIITGWLGNSGWTWGNVMLKREFTDPVLINASTDMNDLGPGIYYQRYGSTAMPVNAPADQYNAYVRVYKAGETGIVQKWYSMNTKKLWIRQLTASGGTWSNWICAGMSTMFMDMNTGNYTSYTFNAPRSASGNYAYFLLVGGTSPSKTFLYLGFVHNNTGDNAVTLTLIGGTAVSDIAGSYNGTNQTLTITMTAIQYGGLRLLWFGN